MKLHRLDLPALLATVLLCGPPAGLRADAAAPAAPSDMHGSDMHAKLMQEVEAMNGAGKGIFREDVTAMLAPYFPLGLTLAETRKVVAAQHLGTLHPFMGVNDPGMGKMYVSRVDLMSRMTGQVHAVLDFDFDGADDGSHLKRMQAFIQSSTM